MDLLDVFIDALLDCLKLLPFLLATVFFMEILEHRAAEKLTHTMERAGRLGPLVGAALGCIPQCGFSAASAQLFNGGLISAGTLGAGFLSTSDEALPILLAQPEQWGNIGPILLCKIVIALSAGLLLDALWKPERQRAAYQSRGIVHECPSDGKFSHILLATLKRTGSILLFLFAFTLCLNLLIGFIGEERLAKLLLPGPIQPFLAALVGLIPNCASSVLLTRLYIDGMITFGSAIAGLSSAADVGLLVLLRGKRSAKTYAVVLLSTYGAAVLFGSLLQMLQ